MMDSVDARQGIHALADGLLIRPASSDDFDGVCSLITSADELFRVYPAGRYPFTIGQLEELAQVRKSLTVMLDANRVIAFANLYDVIEGQSAFIGNVVVDRTCRGRGLGKRLVRHMIETARQQYRLSEIRISVFNSNTAAMLLYAGLGFVPYAVEARIDPHGNRVALVHMKQRLITGREKDDNT